MKATHPILEYSPRASPPTTLTLEESDGSIRVIFAVAPVWVYWVPVFTGFIVGTMKLAAGIFFATLIWRLFHSMGPLPPDSANVMRHFIISLLAGGSIGAVFWWGVAAHAWWSYRRWGRVPRVLTADDQRLTRSWLGWRKMRERVWSAADIKGIEYQLIKGNLNWKRTVANLYIHRHKGRRIRFRLSSPDPHLPRRIAERIASRVGCQLVVND